MPNNSAQATPEMVNNLGGLDEFELTEEGVRPLSPQNSAEPSPQASPGAVAEPVSSTPEPQPQQSVPSQTAPAGQPPVPAASEAQPAQQVVEPAPQSVVTVVPGTAPQATQQPTTARPSVETAPATEEHKAKPEDEAASLGRLNTFLEQQKGETLEEARKTVQSQHDRQTAQVDRQLKDSQTRVEELTGQVREIQTRDLTDAERAKVQETWAQQDERSELDAYRSQLVDYHKSVFVDSLLLDYKGFGVAREAIEAIETPEEMELHCEQQKSSFLEKKLSEGQAPTQVAATPTQRPPEAPAQPTAAQPAATEPTVPTQQPAPAAPPQPNAPVPAGATAPSDVGSGGVPNEGNKFSQESGGAAMQDNLRHMNWDTVRVRQA